MWNLLEQRLFQMVLRDSILQPFETTYPKGIHPSNQAKAASYLGFTVVLDA